MVTSGARIVVAGDSRICTHAHWCFLFSVWPSSVGDVQWELMRLDPSPDTVEGVGRARHPEVCSVARELLQRDTVKFRVERDAVCAGS